MSIPFDHWARAEIARLRAEADALERALSKYSETQRPSAPIASGVQPAHSNGHAPRKGGRKKAAYGTKTAFVMGTIESSGITGISTDDLFRQINENNIGIARSSLRSMLWHAKDAGEIEQRNSRWYKKQEGPTA
jgi:hypothetical protein